eukprot:7293358-Alexandrium_andersonii.AAC.1
MAPRPSHDPRPPTPAGRPGTMAPTDWRAHRPARRRRPPAALALALQQAHRGRQAAEGPAQGPAQAPAPRAPAH